MTQPAYAITHLGAATEARLEEAFAHSVLITAAQAASLLGLDEKTFGALVGAGAVKPVLIGQKTKRYTEADLRAFLAHQTERAECRSTNRRKAASTNMTSSTKVVGFMEARAKRRGDGRSK